jgi:serine/threonine-protein kinase BUR1
MPDGTPRFQGCSRIQAYEVMEKLGEGTFGEVHKARSIKNGSLVALKKILMHNEKDGFPITALREVKLLKMLRHPNVLHLEEMAVEHRKTEGRKKAVMYMVTPYMDHDLSGLLENPSIQITEPQIKCYMLQLLEGVRYLHAMQILHRDMKAANLLINNKGILQIADFGLARLYRDPPPQPGKGNGIATVDYTTVVVTRWYRPPELLLQLRKYTPAVDMWGVGCVFGEMFRKRPILAGSSDLNQIKAIFELVGSPTEANMPGWSELPGCEGVKAFKSTRSTLHTVFRECGSQAISLLAEFLTLDWRKRINAIDALKHPYFTTQPLPARPGDLPQFEESHELDRRKFREREKLPPAPAGGTVGINGQQGGDWGNSQSYGNGNRRGPHDRRSGAVPPPPPPQRNGFNGGGGRDMQVRGGAPNRDPGWIRPPQNGAHGLPPRPPPPAGSHGGRTNDAPRNGPPRSQQGIRGGPNMDTYIPSYGTDENPRDRRDAPPRRDRDDRGRHAERGAPHGGRDDRSRSPAKQVNRDRVRDNSKDIYGRR